MHFAKFKRSCSSDSDSGTINLAKIQNPVFNMTVDDHTWLFSIFHNDIAAILLTLRCNLPKQLGEHMLCHEVTLIGWKGQHK